MRDFEKLLQDNLKPMEKTPPDGTWERLQNRLDKETKYHRNRKWKTYSAVALAAVATATTIAIANRHPNGDNNAPSATYITTLDASALEEKTIEKQEETIQVVKAEPIVSSSCNNTTSLQAADHEGQQPAAQEPQLPSGIEHLKELGIQPDQSYEQMTSEPIEPTAATKVAPATTPTPEPTVSTATREPQDTRRNIDQILRIPNLLTPNGDGYNDCWVLHDLENFSNVQVQIFNSHNKIVYSSKKYTNDFCGEGLPEGNYFYIITIKEKNYSRRGVLVIKK